MTRKKIDQAQSGHLAGGGPLMAQTDASRQRGARRSIDARRSIKKLAEEKITLQWGKTDGIK